MKISNLVYIVSECSINVAYRYCLTVERKLLIRLVSTSPRPMQTVGKCNLDTLTLQGGVIF